MMPIYVAGKSLCPLCRQPIAHGEDYIGFPSFLKRTHSFSILSDAIVHQRCFKTWEYRDAFSRLLEEFEIMLDARPRDLEWREGEKWIKARSEEFDKMAESLDPAKKR
jgi:hypothetical protein